MSNTSSPAAGWYADPQGTGLERWWNGAAWTATTRVAPSAAGETFVLPPRPPVPAGPAYGVAPVVGAVPVNPYGTVPPFQALAPWDPSRTALQPAVHGAPYGWAGGPWSPAPPVSTMPDAIRAVFSRYATFEGRASRSEYWYWALLNVIVSVGGVFVLMISFLTGVLAFLGVLVYAALIAWSITVFVPTLAVSVRRLRDAALPWALIFLALVPFGSIVLLVLHCQPSKR